MRKKKNKSDLVTESFLKNELNKFATKDDLKKTERTLRGEIQKEIALLEARVQLMIDKLKGDIVEENKTYRDEFLTTIDPILKEILVAREDRTITTHRLVELQEKVEGHEEQIRQLKQR